MKSFLLLFFTLTSISDASPMTFLNDLLGQMNQTKKVNQRFITVRGQVNLPGGQAYRPGITLSEVVINSQPNEFAAQNRVTLIRNGKLYKYSMKIDSHRNLKLYPEDLITLETKKWLGN